MPKIRKNHNEFKIKMLLPVPESADVIVLLSEPEAREKKEKNLLRMDSLLVGIVWEVGALQQSADSPIPREAMEFYTVFQIKNDTIFAYTATGYVDSVDINTGQILQSTFEKQKRRLG